MDQALGFTQSRGINKDDVLLFRRGIEEIARHRHEYCGMQISPKAGVQQTPLQQIAAEVHVGARSTLQSARWLAGVMRERRQAIGPRSGRRWYSAGSKKS